MINPDNRKQLQTFQIYANDEFRMIKDIKYFKNVCLVEAINEVKQKSEIILFLKSSEVSAIKNFCL